MHGVRFDQRSANTTENKTVLRVIKTYVKRSPVFMDQKTQCYSDVNHSQIKVWAQYYPNQKRSRFTVEID